MHILSIGEKKTDFRIHGCDLVKIPSFPFPEVLDVETPDRLLILIWTRSILLPRLRFHHPFSFFFITEFIFRILLFFRCERGENRKTQTESLLLHFLFLRRGRGLLLFLGFDLSTHDLMLLEKISEMTEIDLMLLRLSTIVLQSILRSIQGSSVEIATELSFQNQAGGLAGMDPAQETDPLVLNPPDSNTGKRRE